MHSHMQHGEQAAGTGGVRVVARVQSGCGSQRCGGVARRRGPECCRGWAQALWGGQAGRAQRSSCCKRAAGMYEALAWDGLGASLEPMVRICGFWWVSAADCLMRKK